MNLYVVTQERECMIALNSVKYEYYKPFFTESRIHSLILNDRYVQEYETKERAMEVFYEIQSRITSNECLKSMVPSLSTVKGEEEKIGALFKNMIYEMPER